MTTPARRHRQRMTAARAGTSPAAQRAAGDQHDLMLAALWEARRRLKDIKSIARKVEAKRELLPQFDDYVEGVLESDSGEQDEVVMTVMLWCFDIGDLNGALVIGAYALRHGLQTPDRYQRDTASVIAEQSAEEALKQLGESGEDEAAAEAADAILSVLLQAEEITAEADMHDQIRAKLHKALGYALRAQGDDLAGALGHLQRALELNAKIGVKKDVERLERAIKNAGGQEDA